MARQLQPEKSADTKHEVQAVTAPAQWKSQMDRILFTENDIQGKVKELAASISRHYSNLTPLPILCVGLLKGAFVFTSDLCRHLTVPYVIDFMVVSSYGSGTKSSGSVKLKKDLDIDPSGKHILILEDLIDTGTTLAWIKTHLQTKDCASVRICCLLDKTTRHRVQIRPDWVGFDCEDAFVVGYGMDFAEQYRCLPFVGVLKPEAYAQPKKTETSP